MICSNKTKEGMTGKIKEDLYNTENNLEQMINKIQDIRSLQKIFNKPEISKVNKDTMRIENNRKIKIM